MCKLQNCYSIAHEQSMDSASIFDCHLSRDNICWWPSFCMITHYIIYNCFLEVLHEFCFQNYNFFLFNSNVKFCLFPTLAPDSFVGLFEIKLYSVLIIDYSYYMTRMDPFKGCRRQASSSLCGIFRISWRCWITTWKMCFLHHWKG